MREVFNQRKTTRALSKETRQLNGDLSLKGIGGNKQERLGFNGEAAKAYQTYSNGFKM